MLKDIFGCAENHEKRLYGLGYNLTMTRSTDNAVLKEDNPINNGKIKTIAIEWFVPHYTPSISPQVILLEQIQRKTPRASISRKNCFHERGKYSKYLEF